MIKIYIPYLTGVFLGWSRTLFSGRSKVLSGKNILLKKIDEEGSCETSHIYVFRSSYIFGVLTCRRYLYRAIFWMNDSSVKTDLNALSWIQLIVFSKLVSLSTHITQQNSSDTEILGILGKFMNLFVVLDSLEKILSFPEFSFSITERSFLIKGFYSNFVRKFERILK